MTACRFGTNLFDDCEDLAPSVPATPMIVEGSMTAQDAMRMGSRWDAVVAGGDALAMRNA